MNSADMRHKAIETLAVGGRLLKDGGISPEEWIEAIEEAESLMASARRKEAEEMAMLEERWAEIKRRLDRNAWAYFALGAGAVLGLMAVGYLIERML